MVRSAGDGSLENIMECLRLGVNLNAIHSTNLLGAASALMNASSNGMIYVVRMLMKDAAIWLPDSTSWCRCKRSH
jgi:hypothetical protein